MRWAWSLNAAASVVGSALAIFCAVYLGLMQTMLGGALLYAVAHLLAGRSAAGGRWSHLFMPSQPTAPVALDKAYGLALWLIAKIGAMPRTHRFTLGDRIYSQSLDLVTTLTQATFSRDKSRALETAGDRVNSLRILLRLAKDIQLISFDSYTYATGLLDEIGRMIGGWRKSQ